MLLIDGDLRKQDDTAIIGLRDGAGLREVVSGEKTLKDSLRKLKRSGIWFLGSRRTVKQPASVLANPRLGQLIQGLKKEMDYIIIDTPPCEMFQDAGMLSDWADGILYVVKYDFIPQRRIWEGLSFLGDRNTKILGYVFNCYPESVSEYSYGRYGYGRYGYGRYGNGKYGYGNGPYRQSDEQDIIYEGEEQIPLKVCRGMELMVNEGLLQAGKKGLLPGYGGSRSLLVEFFFDISRDRALKWTEELLDMGYRIVLAHPERYDFAKKQPEALGAFWKRGVILQVNKGSILGELGRRAARTADWLLGRGMAGAVASDAHDPVMRTPDLGEAGRVLDIYYGSDASYVLLERNPGRILEGISKT